MSGIHSTFKKKSKRAEKLHNGDSHNIVVTAVIQARMQSNRLPGKAILPLAGKPLISHVIERALQIQGVNNLILATGAGSENDELSSIARETGCTVFRGSENNVLERFYFAVKELDSHFIIRITGDNPFMDPYYASKTVKLALESEADICAIANLPLGIAVEIIKYSALEDAYNKSDKPYHFEHVTPYLKENKDKYNILRHQEVYENPFENLRLTVDAPEDYEFAQILYNELYRGKPFLLKDIFSYLKKNPHHATINSSIRQRKMTEADE
jgi:spore coat polysaccharide biosynthesis protein SpsF (cytidylyltransferase family)